MTDNRCGCSCHTIPGVKHVAACCSAPSFDFLKRVEESRKEYFESDVKAAAEDRYKLPSEAGPGDVTYSYQLQTAFIAGARWAEARREVWQ